MSLKNLGIVAELVAVLVAGVGIFFAGYYAHAYRSEKGAVTELTEVRAVDARNIADSARADQALTNELDAIGDTKVAVITALDKVAPLAPPVPRKPMNRPTPMSVAPSAVEAPNEALAPDASPLYDADPYLSLDAVRLLNAARAGTAADAARISDEAVRASPSTAQ